MAFRYAGTGWRVAGSIRTFGEQIHSLRGHRNSYPVDGTLGDVAHSNRTSDHNPDSQGIVRALDFYEHQVGIVDRVAETLRLARDPRLKYFIHDRRMFSSYATTTTPAWTWRTYSGVNGHINHGHLSVVADSRADLTHPWPMPTTTRPEDDLMAWLKPGDPVDNLDDARAVFNYQGPAVFSGPDFTYDENDPRFLDERLKVIVARVVNILMVHDARIRAEEAEGGETVGLNDAQVRAIALEAGAQVFVEKGKPVVIRGS